MDLISRQAVYDALDNIRIPRNASWYLYYQQALTAVSKLPSAQPTDADVQKMQDIEQAMLEKAYECGKRDAQEIIRCKDCIYQMESWSGIKYCEAHGDHIGKDNDYCSNARRRDNERSDQQTGGD